MGLGLSPLRTWPVRWVQLSWLLRWLRLNIKTSTNFFRLVRLPSSTNKLLLRLIFSDSTSFRTFRLRNFSSSCRRLMAHQWAGFRSVRPIVAPWLVQRVERFLVRLLAAVLRVRLLGRSLEDYSHEWSRANHRG